MGLQVLPPPRFLRRRVCQTLIHFSSSFPHRVCQTPILFVFVPDPNPFCFFCQFFRTDRSEPCHQLHSVLGLPDPGLSFLLQRTNVNLLACVLCAQSSFPLSTSLLPSKCNVKLSSPLKASSTVLSRFHLPPRSPDLWAKYEHRTVSCALSSSCTSPVRIVFRLDSTQLDSMLSAFEIQRLL